MTNMEKKEIPNCKIWWTEWDGKLLFYINHCYATKAHSFEIMDKFILQHSKLQLQYRYAVNATATWQNLFAPTNSVKGTWTKVHSLNYS